MHHHVQRLTSGMSGQIDWYEVDGTSSGLWLVVSFAVCGHWRHTESSDIARARWVFAGSQRFLHNVCDLTSYRYGTVYRTVCLSDVAGLLPGSYISRLTTLNILILSSIASSSQLLRLHFCDAGQKRKQAVHHRLCSGAATRFSLENS